MEILVGGVIVVILALILGVSPELIMTIITVIMALVTGLMTFFFLLNLVRLFGTKRVEGRLTGLREHERFKYPWAFYEIEGEEYRNVFPCEVILRDRIYPEGKKCTLWFNKRGGRVYDMNAFLCVIVGTALSLNLLAVLIWELKTIF